MKNLIIVLALAPLAVSAQITKSGVVYSSHPALDAVEAMNKAFVDGDSKAYVTYFSPDVKIYSIGETEPTGLERDLEITEWWIKNFDITMSRSEGVNPDVIKYKGDKKGVWVMDWTEFMAINKTSGDTVKTWFHDEYFVNNDNKITKWFQYFNENDLGEQIQNSFGAHRNGRVYDEHPLIKKVESLIKSYETGNVGEMASYFSTDAKFDRKGGGDFEPYSKISLNERAAIWAQEITANPTRVMEEYGYPDAIRYEKGDGGWEVLSWWYHIGITEEGEEDRTFIHLSHSFNDEGKISREVLWVE
ncbi:MAG: Uncharacterised protein [Owenweeksia sp. TMED14]|nr:MAG: Uncharacterised protein [Owenweeksia sp. TMED14]|tara:strand:+ start:1958 stop:2866 length:909 start_codon:yes stop_codon:yes gene_type:complete